MSEPATEVKVDSSVTSPTAEQPKKKKDKKKPRKRSSKKALPKTKVIVRRLPPNIPEEIFHNSVKQWVNESTTGWQLFVPGKLSTRLVIIVQCCAHMTLPMELILTVPLQ